MKLLVLLLLALPALSSASHCICKDSKPVLFLDQSLKNRVPKLTGNRTMGIIKTFLALNDTEKDLNQFSTSSIDQTNLEWQTWAGSLPNGAISIYNGYVGWTDYICRCLFSTYKCNAGFYSPREGPYCFFPYINDVYRTNYFQILVNKDSFELMEWKQASHGSVPQNSVKTCSDKDLYVAKNEYGLGVMQVQYGGFFLPWVEGNYGDVYYYRTYQVLTFNRNIVSEHITDVKYSTDGVSIVKYPPETMRKSTISNKECQPVTGTATLTKTSEVEQTWETSVSVTVGVTSTITAQMPLIGSAEIGFSMETTVQFTQGTTYRESISYSVTIQHIVPPNNICTVSMMAHKYGADIPYTARLRRTYQQGEKTWTSISGTYKSVQIGEVRAVVDRCEPLPDPKPCD